MILIMRFLKLILNNHIKKKKLEGPVPLIGPPLIRGSFENKVNSKSKWLTRLGVGF